MLLYKALISLFFILALSNCGFEPVYSQKSGANIPHHLAQIKINDIQGRNGQIIRTQLSNMLDPTNLGLDKKYELSISIKITNVGLAIQKDTTITRYKVKIDSNYTLKDIETGNIIKSGSIDRVGGYDKADSDYATFVSESKAQERILKELARDYKMRLMSLLN